MTGVISGSILLLISLFLLIFPTTAMKIFHINTGVAGGVFQVRVTENKIKVGSNPTIKQAFGERAKNACRIIGSIGLLMAGYAYMYGPL